MSANKLLRIFKAMVFKRRQHGPDYEQQRQQMVADQLAARDISDSRVLKAMGTVPREEFVPLKRRDQAYSDGPLPIGEGQTISQPYVVASMTQSLQVEPDHRVLEIGTGCGYQAAVLAELAKEVYTVEVIQPLMDKARRTLKSLGYRNIHYRVDDGSKGWPEEAPFDGIIVTAAAPKLPENLVAQLRFGGRMIIPMASDSWGRQFLYRITCTEEGYQRDELYEVRFVPMVGDVEL